MESSSGHGVSPASKTIRKGKKMSVSDNANHLISHSNDYKSTCYGIAASASDILGSAIQSVEQVNLTTQDSIGTVTSLLGSGHPAASSLAGQASAVVEKGGAAQAAINVAINHIMELEASVAAYANAVSDAGHGILNSGG
jgi:hypothetical protein